MFILMQLTELDSAARLNELTSRHIEKEVHERNHFQILLLR